MLPVNLQIVAVVGGIARVSQRKSWSCGYLRVSKEDCWRNIPIAVIEARLYPDCSKTVVVLGTL